MISHDPTADLDAALSKAAKEVAADLIVMASHLPGLTDDLWPPNGGTVDALVPQRVFRCTVEGLVAISLPIGAGHVRASGDGDPDRLVVHAVPAVVDLLRDLAGNRPEHRDCPSNHAGKGPRGRGLVRFRPSGGGQVLTLAAKPVRLRP